MVDSVVWPMIRAAIVVIVLTCLLIMLLIRVTFAASRNVFALLRARAGAHGGGANVID